MELEQRRTKATAGSIATQRCEARYIRCAIEDAQRELAMTNGS
jgi:hypothetical protein